MNLRLLSFVFIAFYIVALQPAAAQNWQWAQSNGGSGNESAAAVTTDAWGNVYAAGYFSSASFNFSFFPMNNTTSGFNDIFLVKYDPNGTVLWAVSAGGSDNDYATSVSTDRWGNVFIAGYFFSSSITIGTTTLTNSGSVDSSDMYVAKFDSLGAFKWARKSGGVKDDRINAMMTDISGNVIVTGSFQSAYLAFPGTTDTIKNPITGVDKVFVIKYDSLGNYVWSGGADGVGYNYAYALSTDPGNNIYVAGAFSSSTITFGDTVLNITPGSAGLDDMFVVKYDSMGTLLWARSGGGTGNDIPTAAKADNYGNIYVTGKYSSATPKFGTTTLGNAGGNDIFLVKYNLFGSFKWAKSSGGSADDIPHAIAIDDSFYVTLAGNFASPTLPFGSSTLNFNGVGLNAIFIGKYDTSGNARWGATTGPGHGDVNGVAVAYPGKIYVAGDFSDTTFWFGNDTVQNVIHTGTSDMFVAKYSETPLSVPTIAAKGHGMAIYPNPNNGMMTVSFGEMGYSSMEIYDCVGQLVYQSQLSGNQNAIRISAMDLNDGVYLLRASHNGTGESATFVIRR